MIDSGLEWAISANANLIFAFARDSLHLSTSYAVHYTASLVTSGNIPHLFICTVVEKVYNIQFFNCATPT
jgi:hypothetical protein